MFPNKSLTNAGYYADEIEATNANDRPVETVPCSLAEAGFGRYVQNSCQHILSEPVLSTIEGFILLAPSLPKDQISDLCESRVTGEERRGPHLAKRFGLQTPLSLKPFFPANRIPPNAKSV